jgi:NitT/TauT family transport system substrate-binding protein
MRRNLFLKNILLALITVNLAACSTFTNAAPPPPLRVEYTQWWGDYTLLVAKEKGFFEKYNVDVEVVYYEVFSDAYADLAAGQIDAAMIAVGDVISINHHTPVQAVGVLDDGSYMPIVANPNSPSISDLKGKSIGTLVGTPYEMLVISMLESAEINPSEVMIRNINPEESIEALKNNEIQAAFTWEPFTTQAVEAGAHILYPLNNDVRLFPDTIAFRKNIIDQRPEDVRGFMQAWFEAINYRLYNPEETRQIASRYTGIPLEQIKPDLKLKIFTYEDNLDIYSQSNPNSIFSTAQKNADYLISAGLLSVPPDITKIITPDFLARP